MNSTMITKILKKAAILLFWIAVWQLASYLVNVALILPTPLSTLTALKKLCITSDFYKAVFLSLFRIVLGFVLGVVVGFLGAILSNKIKLVSEIFAPIIKLLRAVPVASFIIIAFYWFKSSEVPTLICFLMVMPMIWSSVETELLNIDKKYIEVAKIYKLSASKTFFGIKLPIIMPNFLTTMLTALGFAWKSGIAAEIICIPPDSLGGTIQASKNVLLTDEVFALTLVVIFLSIILESIVKFGVRRVLNDKIN